MAPQPQVTIIKASGNKEPYDRKKFCTSLKRAGIDQHTIEEVCQSIESKLKPETTTDVLFQYAFSELLKRSPVAAGKYSLKSAIMQLGPTGFVFEQFFGAVLKEYGYTIKTNQEVRGKCTSHEIDVLASNDTEEFYIEAKYHNARGIKSDIQPVMYTFARVLDIQEKGSNHKIKKAWLVTNTKFTSKAKQYAKCRDIKITGWRYPAKEGLEVLIDKKGLYPITALPAVNQFAKNKFSEHNILFAKDVARLSKEDLLKMDVYPHIAEDIIQQAHAFAVS